MMDGFDAYKTYLALKSHFSSKTYDYFKYNGAIRAKRESYETRKDRYFFQKLAKQKDLVNYLVALFVYGQKDYWVGDMVRNEESEALYGKWQKVNQSITYTFSEDLDNLDEDFASNFVVVDGQHPKLLKSLFQNQIHIETFIILNDIVRFSGKWNKNITETYIWPEVRLKCKKYQPFLTYDKEKCKQILVDRFGLSQ
jgi:hypothetical protein